MNVDVQATDWGTVVQRRASRTAPDKGGWSVFFTSFAGLDQYTPASTWACAATAQGWSGWPTDAAMERCAPTGSRPATCRAEEGRRADPAQAFQDVPYLPLGEYFQQTVRTKKLTGALHGIPLFWNVDRSA